MRAQRVFQMDNTVIINDYRQMDKVLKEGRQYLLNICKKIKKANCNVLLIQKSILRDAVDDTSLNFLKRLNILAVKDVERDEIEFLSKSLGCKPISDIDAFTEDKLGYADLVEETNVDEVKVVRITGVKNRGKTVSVLAMGSNSLVLEECERSLHDALCVVRCLVKKRYASDSVFSNNSLILTYQQSSDWWGWCPGDSRFQDAVPTRTITERHGGVLLPSICRCT
jgi:T-complex protein 1 subunit delta